MGMRRRIGLGGESSAQRRKMRNGREYSNIDASSSENSLWRYQSDPDPDCCVIMTRTENSCCAARCILFFSRICCVAFVECHLGHFWGEQ